ncbi:hypothetical protein PPL_10662 [Heterostelium album PN500]|uniref:Myb-like domain-containing protein n=1 Tax=Heterostelium pallidum (strain ATCC 26659 / Pp 5 / PN500) TaxID=670386 RepID=D3BRQ1_HETP5|nr:hypothetical protein PPL_10662 [Heterostelium album PN500]EFA76083.1 hypothetical protein PPL_10662 [Heterostelium album PN500]|eukprot:XP_020428217.1 hypothetical protein PPL_10662 [Heterostelium album PN500]
MNLSYILNPISIPNMYNISKTDNDIFIMEKSKVNSESLVAKEMLVKNQTPSKVQIKPNFLYNWSPVQVEILIRMVIECDFYSLDPMERRNQWEKIAKSLNRTVPAVRAKFSRLKLDSKLKQAAL